MRWECKQESDCKFPMSSGAGAGVTFLGTGVGAQVKKETPITSGPNMAKIVYSLDLVRSNPDLCYCSSLWCPSLHNLCHR